MPNSSSTSENGLSQDAYQVLAQANLLRVRGQWDDAVELCMAAMKMDPDNVSVLSLLGDIYENQGRLDDAVQWYRLALDKNPESPADHLKLKSVLTMQEHNTVAQAPELLADAAADWSDTPRTFERPPAFNHNVLNITLRAAAYGLAIAFAIVVAYGLSSSAPHRVHVPSGANRDFESDPVFLQTNGSAGSISPSGSRDASELTLLNTLAADPQLAGFGVNVSDVSDDPRSGNITVTALYTANDPTFAGKPDILRAALRTAVETSVHTDTASTTSFTVRILLSNATTGADNLTFAGDITRLSLSAMPSDPTAIPDSQLLTKFDNPWWAPDFTG